MKNQHAEIFCFSIENRHFAIPLEAVGQVLMATAVLPVPNAPPFIHGLIDYHGLVVPVINLRSRLKLPQQPVRVHDIFIIACTSNRTIALVADEAIGVVTPDTKDLVFETGFVSDFEASGFLRRDDGIILIYDIEKFLSREEDIEVQAAIDDQPDEINKP